MIVARLLRPCGLALGAVIVASGLAHGEDLSGTVVRTLLLSENSR